MARYSGFLKTKDVLQATGITHQILYRYVTLGLIQERQMKDGGHRLFAPETVGVIKLIQRLNQSGYTLRDIKDIFLKDARVAKLQKTWSEAAKDGAADRAVPDDG